jgi:cellulose synthase/poly-beta-1,6-N-acetylglucosamine synthase-like glycosyltransferase
MSSHSSITIVGAPPVSVRRRAVGFLLVAPLVVLLALRLNHFVHDPLFCSYGAAVLGTSAIVIFLAFSRYRDPSLDPVPSPATPPVSCLVAVKNEEGVITSCVDSLFASVGKKRALTTGVQYATGDIFVFSDSDCVVEPDAISHIVRAFCAHPDVGAVSGHARALNASRNLLTKTQDTWYEGQFSVWKAAESVFGAVTCISGPLAGFRREAVFNFLPAWANDRFLGKDFPFATDRQLTAYVLGAPYVGEELKRRYADSPFVRGADYPCVRWRTGYVKSARVRTVVPWTLRRLVKQQIRWKKSFIRNLFFVGSFQWRRGPVPAVLFYGRAVFIVAAPLMAFRHLVWLPMHGAYALTLLYLLGIVFKGCIWAFAYRSENPGCARWIYRPLMSLMTVLLFSMLLPYSLLTIRRGAWSRG